MNRVKEFLGAYSSRYIAAPTPSGMEMVAVRLINQSVPNKADLIPAFSGKREGKSFKNCKSSQ
jgi:hypothetical protein